jgi:hypothetical protein
MLGLLSFALTNLRPLSVEAEPCDTAQYQYDCWTALSNLDTFCNNLCYREFGGWGWQDGGVCHWIGENEYAPDCLTNHPNDCGCFSGVTDAACYCIIV